MNRLDLSGAPEVSLQTLAYRQVLDAIIRLELPPGARLVETRLAEELGVSRMPIREALRQLEKEQLVETSHHRGATVAPLTVRDARDVYTLRITLEALAARLAAENAGGPQIRAMEAAILESERALDAGQTHSQAASGARFHAAVVAASDNRKLEAVLGGIAHHVARLRTVQVLTASPESARLALEGHRAIFQAIARRQGRRAEKLMEEHVRRALERIAPILADATPESLARALVPAAIPAALAAPPESSEAFESERLGEPWIVTSSPISGA